MNTPAPTPALTDEDIDKEAVVVEQAYVRAKRDWWTAAASRRHFNQWLAAVIARAKREAAEEIAASIAARLTGDKHGCLRYGVDCPACRALDRAIDYVKEATDDPR